MAGLNDLVGGFQQGYGFTTDQRQKRRVNEYLSRNLDKMDRERAFDLDYAQSKGIDLEALGYTQGQSFAPQTYGEKLLGTVKGWFQKSQQEDAMAQEGTGAGQVQEEPKGRGRANFDDGGPVRGYAGPVRRALETRRQAPRTSRPNPNVSYADGGDVELDEEGRRYREPTSEEGKRARSRKEARTGRAQAPNPTSTQNVPGKTRGYTAREKVNKAAGGKSKALNLDDAWNEKAGVAKEKPWYKSGVKGAAGRAARFAARAATPAAAIYSAHESLGTGTEEYQRRGGIYDKFAYDDDDSNLEMFGKDLATRTIGTFEDLGHTLTGGIFRPDSYDQEPEEAPATALPGAPEVAPAIEEAVDAPPPPEEVAAQVAEKDPPGQAVQKGPPGPDIIDMSKVQIPPNDLPRHTTDEWARERERLMGMAALAGKNPWEVGEAITKDQILNFTSYAYQAQMLLAGNDPMSAARALTAAYNYFPNGSDIKFGMVEGKDGKRHLIGMGVDEQTGEQIGTPMMITPESLGTMIEMAQNPDAWRVWTKDWRDEDLNRRIAEWDRQYKEGMLGVAQENARTNAIRAENSYMSRTGSGGLKQSDVDRAAKELREIFTYYSGEDFEPERVDELMQFSVRLYDDLNGALNYESLQGSLKEALRQNPDATEQEIFEYILRDNGLVE